MAVIVLSPYPDDVEQEMFYQAGAKNYLLKDINTSHLVAAIRGTVSSS
jgi:DNA-binding NarL/FixJ family response regulator